jgi:hypothetical protein
MLEGERKRRKKFKRDSISEKQTEKEQEAKGTQGKNERKNS